MKGKSKNTSLLRRILTVSIALCFVFFLLVFIYQYVQYKRIEERLTAAYSSTHNQSSNIYRLFSTFSEADNLFRLYTVDHSADNYNSYKGKLDTMKMFIDSIANIPIENNPLKNSDIDLQLSQNYAAEFALLRKKIDDLVFYAADSLVALNEKPPLVSNRRITTQHTDSVINQILQDTLSQDNIHDTIVREKGSLIKRIFNTKSDTLVITNSREVFNNTQINILHRNIEHFIETNEKNHCNDLKDLQLVMLKMRNKERELVLSNHNLLYSLKEGLDNLKQLELNELRKAEAKDFDIYKQNFKQFTRQLIIAVVIMLLMTTFIVYYSYKTSLFEKKLCLEKEYASKIAEEKTSILANVSHEVRAPINSLKGIINILKNNNRSEVIDKEIIQAVDKDINVINSTLNDILSLSKLEVDSLEIKCDYFSPFQLLEDIIHLHKYQAKVKGLLYNYQNNIDKDISINSNIFRIKQIVSNLITNAIKYTSKGEIIIQADLKTVSGQHKLTVSVKDTGAGIENSKKDQVFRKYYVADPTNRLGGFGLGLYISKLLSEQLGGDISFTSKFGKGSVFTFELPIDKKHLKTDKLRSYKVDDIPDDLEILIVDDNRISLFFMQQLFNTRKNVHLFHSAVQAWNYLQHNKADLVITDLIMPEMDGWQLLHAIKSNSGKSHIRVLVATAEPMLLEEKTGFPYKFDGVLAKPLQENDVVKAIMDN